MSSHTRHGLFAVAAGLLVLGGAALYLDSAKADVAAGSEAAGSTGIRRTPGSGAERLILGTGQGTEPKTMEQFLTAVTKDVDAYWTEAFKPSGLPEPKVSYEWIPPGQTAASACGTDDGTLGDSTSASCPGDDTLYISEKFATDIYD